MEEELINSSPNNNTSPGIDPPKKKGGDVLDLIVTKSNPKAAPMTRTTKEGSVDTYGYNTGLGTSSYDEGLLPASQIDFDEFNTSLEDFRSKTQPWYDKSAAGVGRILTKGLTEVAKMPGVVIGMTAAPFAEEGEGFETAFNNQWVKSLNKLNENINSEYLPVYVKKAVKEGNLWDNISSIDFWATEGADGIGYIASMMVPGMALKSIGLGEKILGATAKGLSLVNGQSKLAGATAALTDLGITAEGIDMASMTLANSMFEAGSEAGNAMENFQKDLDQKLQAGEIDEGQYETLMQQKGVLGRDIFLSNMAILIGPNAIQTKMIWGQAGKRALNTTIPSIGTKIGNRLKNIGTALGSEGFFEEGTQSTVEKMFTDKAEKGQLGNSFLGDFNIGELTDSYLDTVSSTEGQKAIFLGGALGGGMYAYQGGKNDIRDRKRDTNLVDLAESRLNNFNSIYETDPYVRDQEGKIILDKNNKPVYDPVKVSKITKSLDTTEKENKIFELAVQTGNQDVVDQFKQRATDQLIAPFITQGEQGLVALEQYLDQAGSAEELVAGDKNNQIQQTKSEILEKAKYLQEQYQAYNDFSRELINLKNDNANEEDIKDYYNTLADIYVGLKGQEYTERKRLSNYNSSKDKLIKEIGRNNRILNPNPEFIEGTTEEIYRNRSTEATEDPRLKLLNAKIEASKEELDEIDRIVNGFIWNEEEVNKAFSRKVKQNNELRQNSTPENIEEVDKAITDINNANTPEEVDAVPEVTNSTAKPIVQEAAKTKKEALKEQEEVNTQLQKDIIFEEQSLSEMDKIELEIIKSTYQKGRDFVMEGQALKFDRVEGDDIIAINEDGEEVKISVKSNLTNISNPKLQDATDGVDDPTIVSNNENKLEAPQGNGKFKGAKALSTNRTTGEKLDFVSQEYLDYERTPRDKKGEKVNFEINNVTSNPKWKQALESYNSKNFKDKNLLYNFLPINIKFTDTISAPLETLPATEEAKEIFKDTTLPLRKLIIDALIEGKPIESITSVIAGQYEGSLQVQPQIKLPDGTKLTPENSILQLQAISGMERQKQLEYLVDNLYMVNWTGALENVVNSEKLIPTNFTGKGEIYLQIPMNNGKPFNLKLNFKRIEDIKGEAIYDLLRLISASSRDINNPIGRETTLGELKVIDEELYNNLFDNEGGILKAELELYTNNANKSVRKNKDSVTMNDILDILVFKDSINAKTLMFVDIDGNLNLGSLASKQVITRNELDSNSPETKQIVLDFLKNKRYNVLVTKGAKGINFNNPSYLNYILDNNILSTNAVINEPTFQGYSNIYISNDTADLVSGDVPVVISEESDINERAEEYWRNNVDERGFPKEALSEVQKRFSEEEKDLIIQNEINKFIESKLGPNPSTLNKLNASRKYAEEIQAIRDKYSAMKENTNVYTPTEEEVDKVADNLNETTPTDYVDITEADIEELVNRLGTITPDVLDALSKDSNKEMYSELVKLANQRQINIDDIQKRCK